MTGPPTPHTPRLNGAAGHPGRADPRPTYNEQEPPMNQPVTVREWMDIVKRARLGRTVHSVAMTIGSYADFSDGSRVRPGIARLAVDCQLDYSTVKSAFARLREVGLIVLVRKARIRGHADEYRLAIGEQLLDYVDVLSPAQVAIEVERIRARRRRRTEPTDPDGPGSGDAVRLSPPAVQESDEDGVRLSTPAVQPVDNSGVRLPAPAVGQEVTGECTAVRADPDEGCTAVRADVVRLSAPPPITHGPPTTPTPHSLAEVDGNHPAARADAEIRDSRVVEESAGSALPDRCAHGLPARYRADGSSSCALCRREAREAAEPDPPRRRTALRIVRPA